MFRVMRTAWSEAVRLVGQRLACWPMFVSLGPFDLVPIRVTDHQKAPMKKVK